MGFEANAEANSVNTQNSITQDSIYRFFVLLKYYTVTKREFQV